VGRAVHSGFDLRALGAGAIMSLTAAAAGVSPDDPPPADVAALKTQLVGALGPDAPVVIVRDHHVVLLLLADRLFRGADLMPVGKIVVRKTAALLSAQRDRAVVIGANPDLAMETLGQLAIGGLDVARVAIQVKDMDPAINVVELELVAAERFAQPKRRP
jgi:hypothetical protein